MVFLPKGTFLSSGSPHVCPGLWHSAKLWGSAFPHFHTSRLEGTWREHIHRQVAQTQIFMRAPPRAYFLHPLFLFLSDTAELFLEPIPSDKFSTRPSTRGGEGGPCEGLGPNRYCFLCQVSTNRGLSHPFLTPHPWLPERYFAGFTMKPVSSPPALKHGPGRHDKNHSANGNYAVLILRNVIHQKWADRSFHFQGQCPCTPGCLWTRKQMNLRQGPGETIEVSLGSCRSTVVKYRFGVPLPDVC